MRRAVIVLILIALVACKRRVHDWPPAMRTASPAEMVGHVRAAKGEAVLFVLYASWCTSCRRELPAIDALGKRPGVRVLAYSLDEEPEDFGEMLEERAPSFPLVRLFPAGDSDALAARVRELGGDYRASIPYVAVFDRRGTLLGEWSGNAPPRDIDAALTLARR
jgi:thiol-disulfide isomerase/thioredoxin